MHRVAILNSLVLWFYNSFGALSSLFFRTEFALYNWLHSISGFFRVFISTKFFRQ